MLNVCHALTFHIFLVLMMKFQIGNFEKWLCTDGLDVAPHAFRTFGAVLILLERGHPSVRSSLLYMNRNVLRVTNCIIMN